MTDADALFAAYQEQLRGNVPDRLPAGMHAERDGPVVRTVGSRRGGLVAYRDLGGLEGARLDELIRRQVRVFARAANRSSGRRTRTTCRAISRTVCVPPGSCRSRRRRCSSRPSARSPASRLRRWASCCARSPTAHGLARIAALETHIWAAGSRAGSRRRSARGARSTRTRSAQSVAEARGELVCAAWLRVAQGTSFAQAARRRHADGVARPRGLPRARRVPRRPRGRAAAATTCRWMRSAASRPILERLGFSAIASTQPFRWTPSG